MTGNYSGRVSVVHNPFFMQKVCFCFSYLMCVMIVIIIRGCQKRYLNFLFNLLILPYWPAVILAQLHLCKYKIQN